MKQILNTIKNGARAFGLLVMIALLALLALPAGAQSRLNVIPIGIGTVTNTTYTTNVFSWSGALTTNYTTNVVIYPVYSPTNYAAAATGLTNLVSWGASIASPNPNASGAANWTLINGWLYIPPNVQIWQDAVLAQKTSTTNGTAWFGYDLSEDSTTGTAYQPVRVPVTLSGGSTNEYITLLGNSNTNLLGQYLRWDYLSSDFGTALIVVTNRLIFRSGPTF